MTNIARTLIGVTTSALLTTAIACSDSSGPSSGTAGTDGGVTGDDGGGDAGADAGGQDGAVNVGDAGGSSSTKGSGTAHAVFTIGTTTVNSSCEKVKYATYNSMNFWTISCTNVNGDTVSFNDISGTWPTVGDHTATTGFIISMGVNNAGTFMGLSHTPKSFDFNASAADGSAHKLAAVATAAWDASGSEPAGSLTLTFDLTFASE